MSLETLRDEVTEIFKNSWKTRDGQKVPEPKDIALGNEGVNLDATVLYADLAESTNMVDAKKPTFAAEVYKSYLLCCATIVRAHEGAITSYDGDRIMAIFIGDAKNTNAANCALKINYACTKIIMPKLKSVYKQSNFKLKQVVGIDTSNLLAARTGIRKHNDIVWVGRAANYAAKLCSESCTWASWVTEDVYSVMNKSVKYSNDGDPMWKKHYWSYRNMNVYRSTWWRSI